MKRIESIIIFGGGTSGWLTAAYLTKNLSFPVKITLIKLYLCSQYIRKKQ